MKVYTTILGVSKVSVRPGLTDKAGRAVRDVVISSPEGELILRLVGESRDDLQVTYAAAEVLGQKPGTRNGWSKASKDQLDA
jgi:hypothetical protein